MTAHKTLRNRLAKSPEDGAPPNQRAAGLGHSHPTIPEPGRETAKPRLSDDGRTLTVRVPLAIRQRGGRKLVLAPDGQTLTAAPLQRRVDSAMVKAIARAFRWREMLENGEYATIREIAVAEKINETYVGRVLRLTLLSPEIIEAIVNGRQPLRLQLDHLLRRFSVEWREQRIAFLQRKLIVRLNRGEGLAAARPISVSFSSIA